LTEQLSIFDIPLDEPVYEVGNRVRIKRASELKNPDIETVAYLDTFGGKTGTVAEIHKGKSISYRVVTPKGDAWLKEEELAFIS
jgi:hypothetical protein